jgi:CheY-like chemotaxis protein
MIRKWCPPVSALSRGPAEQALNYCGALVTVFSSAEAVLDAMNEYLSTLIMSELSMPGMTGLEFMRRVREKPVEQGGLIPAIAVTAHYEDFAAVIARAAGFETYLTKWRVSCVDHRGHGRRTTLSRAGRELYELYLTQRGFR